MGVAGWNGDNGTLW